MYCVVRRLSLAGWLDVCNVVLCKICDSQLAGWLKKRLYARARRLSDWLGWLPLLLPSPSPSPLGPTHDEPASQPARGRSDTKSERENQWATADNNSAQPASQSAPKWLASPRPPARALRCSSSGGGGHGHYADGVPSSSSSSASYSYERRPSLRVSSASSNCCWLPPPPRARRALDSLLGARASACGTPAEAGSSYGRGKPFGRG